MNDVTVVTSVTYPSPESLALVADVQYHEPYLSAALNRKFRGIVDPGFYAGFCLRRRWDEPVNHLSGWR